MFAKAKYAARLAALVEFSTRTFEHSLISRGLVNKIDTYPYALSGKEDLKPHQKRLDGVEGAGIDCAKPDQASIGDPSSFRNTEKH